jgi:hypothetical protein
MEIGDYRGGWRLERRPAVRFAGPRLGRSGRRHPPRGVLWPRVWRWFSYVAGIQRFACELRLCLLCLRR